MGHGSKEFVALHLKLNTIKLCAVHLPVLSNEAVDYRERDNWHFRLVYSEELQQSEHAGHHFEQAATQEVGKVLLGLRHFPAMLGAYYSLITFLPVVTKNAFSDNSTLTVFPATKKENKINSSFMIPLLSSFKPFIDYLFWHLF